MCRESAYTLADGVQVRREKFGLLFYDYRGPKLYFVPSKNLVHEGFFDGRHTIRELVEAVCGEYHCPHRATSQRITSILDLLHTKGLIHEQSIR